MTTQDWKEKNDFIGITNFSMWPIFQATMHRTSGVRNNNVARSITGWICVTSQFMVSFNSDASRSPGGILAKQRITTPAIEIRSTQFLDSMFLHHLWWGKKLRIPHAVTHVQSATCGRSETKANSPEPSILESRKFWISVNPNFEQHFLQCTMHQQ